MSNNSTSIAAVPQRRLRYFSALLIMMSLVAAACGGTETTDTAGSGQADEVTSSEFPQLTAATLDGGQLEFGSLEGQDSVLWFWAPW